MTNQLLDVSCIKQDSRVLVTVQISVQFSLFIAQILLLWPKRLCTLGSRCYVELPLSLVEKALASLQIIIKYS